MVDYRLYFFSGLRVNGRPIRIEHVETIASEDDEKACVLVEQLGDGRYMELWSSKRMVKAFEPPQ